MDNHGDGFGFFWLPFMFFFWIVIVPRIVGAVKHGLPGRPRPAEGGAPPSSTTAASTTVTRGATGVDPALNTLRERFARGEIDRAEYEERREALARGAASESGNWPY
jgi:hypothetical protein